MTLPELPADALVLDVGGWAKPLPRADWVLDLMPYETRGLYGDPIDPAIERFSADTWVQRDICDRDPWPFADDQFDFAVCSHTLEDVRDPVGVCRELTRVAKAGYVEVPSRAEEQTIGIDSGGAWAGWSHHHWLCSVDAAAPRIDFVFKPHFLASVPGVHLPRGHTPAERTAGFAWEGSFGYGEIVYFDLPELLADLRAVVDAEPKPARRLRRPRRR